MLDDRLVLCDIGGEAYAFRLAGVTEVVPHVAPRHLPGQPLHAGVAVVRGQVLATIDAAMRLGIAAPDPPRRMVLVTTRTGVHAVSVTDVSDITEAEHSRLRATPAGAAASTCVAALVEIDGQLIVVNRTSCAPQCSVCVWHGHQSSRGDDAEQHGRMDAWPATLTSTSPRRIPR